MWHARLVANLLTFLLLGAASVSAHAQAQPVAGPGYSGTLNGKGACTNPYKTLMFVPPGATESDTYPLFIYFVGTNIVGASGTLYDTGVPIEVTRRMAEQNFVALSAGYDNNLAALGTSDRTQQLHCLFDASESNSLIAKACSAPHVDCSKGIALWGHSQGGLLALRGADSEPRVRVAWAAGTGLDALPYTLDRRRVRVLNGVTDVSEHTPAQMGQVTGANPPADCARSSKQCLRADGSGWVIVQAVDGLTGGHCWFMKNGCYGDYSPAAAFLTRGLDKPYSLAANIDWLVRTFDRP